MPAGAGERPVRKPVTGALSQVKGGARRRRTAQVRAGSGRPLEGSRAQIGNLAGSRPLPVAGSHGGVFGHGEDPFRVGVTVNGGGRIRPAGWRVGRGAGRG